MIFGQQVYTMNSPCIPNGEARSTISVLHFISDVSYNSTHNYWSLDIVLLTKAINNGLGLRTVPVYSG